MRYVAWNPAQGPRIASYGWTLATAVVAHGQQEVSVGSGTIRSRVSWEPLEAAT